MLCKNCGNQLREGAAFCPKCGTAVKTNTETAEQEYMPLTPKFDNIDTDKPIQERIKAIDKPLFEDNNEVSEPAPKKKSKKKLIIALSVILAVIIVLGVIVIFDINRPPLTLETAYDAYIDILEKNRDEIEKNAADNNTSNIAFYDYNDTGIPDMFYVVKGTRDGESANQVHIVLDDKYRVYDSVASNINYDKDFVYFKEGDDKSIWYEQFDLKNYNNVRFKPHYSKGADGTNEYENYDMIKFEDKEDAPVTIVLSFFKNFDIDDHFTNIVGDVSLSYDEAIAFLKKKQPLSKQQSESKKTNEKESISIKETKETTLSVATEPPTEQPTEPSTEPPTEPPKAEDYIKIYQEDTYYNKLRKEDYSYVMPLFDIDSSDAEAINEELISSYKSDLKDINAYIAEPYCDGVYIVSYESWLNDNILSLCVEQKLALSVRYLVYNIDITTGKELDNDAIAEHYGTTYSNIIENVRSAVDESFLEKFGQNTHSSFEKYHQQTISDENINQSKLFIGDNNQLYVMYKWYMDVLAAIGNNTCVVNL